ncbi:hypothetical protein D3C81_2252020 [compost metagenome]
MSLKRSLLNHGLIRRGLVVLDRRDTVAEADQRLPVLIRQIQILLKLWQVKAVNVAFAVVEVGQNSVQLTLQLFPDLQ